MLLGSGDTHTFKSSVTDVTRVTTIVNYLYLLIIVVVTLAFLVRLDMCYWPNWCNASEEAGRAIRGNIKGRMGGFSPAYEQ